MGDVRSVVGDRRGGWVWCIYYSIQYIHCLHKIGIVLRSYYKKAQTDGFEFPARLAGPCDSYPESCIQVSPKDLVLDMPLGSCMWPLSTPGCRPPWSVIPCLSNSDWNNTTRSPSHYRHRNAGISTRSNNDCTLKMIRCVTLTLHSVI